MSRFDGRRLVSGIGDRRGNGPASRRAIVERREIGSQAAR
jgi:hypothetical protein